MYFGLLVAKLGPSGWESMRGRLGCNRSLPKAQRPSGGAPWQCGGLPISRSLEAGVTMHRTGAVKLSLALAERSDSVLSASPPI